MILFFHWVIAFCKTTKRIDIGTLIFTNMNLPFVVINLLIVCLVIAGHTTQGDTGSGMLCTTYLALGVLPGKPKLLFFFGNFQILRVFLKVALISATFHKIGNVGKTCNCLPFEVL